MQGNMIKEEKTVKVIRYVLFACCEAFALGSLIYTLILTYRDYSFKQFLRINQSFFQNAKHIILR